MLRSWAVASLLLAVALREANAAIATTACPNFSKRFNKNIDGVCVCTEASCDSVSNGYLTLTKGQVGVYSTSKAGDRLTYTAAKVDATKPASVDWTIDTATTYQSMIGFGGAFTDAAAINIYKLTPALQQKVLDAYYADTGLQYTLGRIPIASCDFSTSVYSYNDNPNDFDMTHFSIDVDRAPNSNKLNLIKRALAMTKREISIFASPWAPPAWMTKENKTEDCHLQGSPGDKYWKALALYYTKFIEAYQAEGIKIWGMTVQNEPNPPPLQLAHWQSLRLSAQEERDFIKLDLGPLLKSKFPNIKLIAHDDQKPDLIDRIAIFQDPDARKYIDGAGFHWYKNLDFWFFETGGDYDKLSSFHNQFPDIFLLATEACEGSLPDFLGSGRGTKLNDPEKMWARGEMYARDIIDDIANWATGWTDWNLALDTTGGPNWAGNLVDAPILVDEVSGTEFYKQPMYYVMGHFAKFVPKGSVRVNLVKSGNKDWGKTHQVAFLTPTKSLVVLFCNRKDSAISTVFQTPSGATFTLSIAAHSVQTVIFPSA